MPRDDTKPTRLSRRKFTTALIMLTFLALLVSGLALFVAPSGRIAREVDWMLLGLGRAGWEQVHIAFTLLFLAAAVLHMVLNLGALRVELTGRRNRRGVQREFLIALAVSAVLFTAAVFAWPPVSSIFDLNEHFKKTFWGTAGEGPGGGRGRGGG